MQGKKALALSTMVCVASGRRIFAAGVGRRAPAAFASRPTSHGVFDFGGALDGRRRGAAASQPRGAPIRRRSGRAAASLFSTAAGQSSSSSPSREEGGFEWDAPLPFEQHTHGSVKITVPPEAADEKSDPYDRATFRSRLEATVSAAERLDKSAVWMTVPISRASLIEESAGMGFAFHHAEGDTATLSRWLLPDQESRIPSYATHQVGVGAMVINEETDEILVVREKRNNYRPWKIPGGLTELGEHLDEAVVREVFEETGIKCNFQNVLAVRHTHGSQFGRSDLYFVCRLEPIPDENGELPRPTPQEGEIEAVAWLKLDDYRAFVHDEDPKVGHPMMSQIMKVVDSSSSLERMIIPSIVPGRKLSPLYHAPVLSDDSTQ